MLRYYRHSTEVVGWVWHADIYCVSCGDVLPDIDPEGNDKHPVFLDTLDELRDYCCGDCGSSCGGW